jgi:sugar phosphate isomerase/epimerase
MKLGICGPLDAVESPIEHLDYLEPAVGQLLQPEQPDAPGLASAVDAAPVKPYAANCLIPGHLPTTGPDTDYKAVQAYMQTTCARAAQAGVRILVFGSGGSRKVPEGFSMDTARRQLVDHMKGWAPAAAEAGVTIVLEPLSCRECNIVTSVDEGADLVRRVGDPSIRLLIDTYHMGRDEDDVDAIRRAGDLIAHAHIAEIDGRTPPAAHGQDFSPWLRALKDIRYNGGLSIEAKWEDRAAQLPGALAELRRQIDEA